MNTQNNLVNLSESELCKTNGGSFIGLLQAAALTSGAAAVGYGAVVITSEIGQNIYDKITN